MFSTILSQTSDVIWKPDLRAGASSALRLVLRRCGGLGGFVHHAVIASTKKDWPLIPPSKGIAFLSDFGSHQSVIVRGNGK